MKKTNKKHPINLIGISGKMGSGKDILGKILQMIPESTNREIIEFIKEDYSLIDSNYQIKKFADKLKDIACLLIGCTREQLEDREFKEKELGEEWWYYKYGDSLYSYKTEKTLLIRVMNSEFLEPCNEEDLNNCLIKLTPRKLLQLLGTEAGREIIHPNIWVNALFADYPNKDTYILDNPDLALFGSKVKSVELEIKKPNWIITDVRFPNEAQAIKDRGGIVIRVNRLTEEQKIASLKARANRPNNAIKLALKNEHPSETALDDYEFDITIDNNGSIEELIEKVKQLNLV